MTTSDPSASASSPELSLLAPPTLSLPLAQQALTASLAQASLLSIPVNISIFSSSLHLLAFGRMDGAKLTSIDISHNKAFTAAGHRAPTDSYGEKVRPGDGLYGVQHSNDGRFCTIQGGEPVLVGGECVGAIGVSGGTPAQDKEIALAGVNRILELLQESNKRQRSRI